MSASAWTPVDETAAKWTPVEESPPPDKPSFWKNPRAFLESRSVDLQREAQNQMNMALGPESEKRGTLARLGHSLLSLAPETGAVVDKLIAGGMDWKNALVVAAGVADPAIPAAYFGTQGTAQLTGLTPGVEKGNTSPENVQTALLAGSAVAGGGAIAGTPSAGRILNPKPAISRALLMGRTPQGAYESALKPSTTISPEERAAIVETGLTEKIPVSKTGLDRIGDLIDEHNRLIKATIDADPNRPISPARAAQNVEATRNRFATQVNPTADVSAIDSAKAEFLDQFRSKPGGAVRDMTAEEAQAMKQGTYRALGDKAYGELKGASIEAQKALARGLKEELAVQFPELKTLNASESRLLDLKPVLEKAVSRISNHQTIGLGSPVVAGAAKAMTGSSKLASAAFVVKAVLDNPVVKSRLAIALSRGAKIPYSQAIARVASYQASLASAVPGLLSASSEDNSNAPKD